MFEVIVDPSPLLGWSVVFKRADVSQRDTEVLDWDSGSQCQPVRRAVRQSLHSDHDAAQTGNLLSGVNRSTIPVYQLVVGQSDVPFLSCVLKMLPLNTNIRLAYANGKDDEQNFIQNLSLFLCTFLKEHGQLIEKRLNLRETLMEVHAVWTWLWRINLNHFSDWMPLC